MICLDPAATANAPDQLRAAVDQIRGPRGAELVHSGRFGCWMIVCRDESKKAQLQRRYRTGVPVYTIAEIERFAGMPEEAQTVAHELVTTMGATIE